MIRLIRLIRLIRVIRGKKSLAGSIFMKTYLLERQQMLPLARIKVFDFFSDAFNLDRITPPFLKFRILTPRPIKMKAGALIEYELGLYGIPIKWQTLIEAWTPPASFVDTQIRGPYLLWHHTHTFEEIGLNQTLMRDLVRYRIPFGPLGRLANWLFIGAMLKRIFDYRAEMIAELLGAGKKSGRGLNLSRSDFKLFFASLSLGVFALKFFTV